MGTRLMVSVSAALFVLLVHSTFSFALPQLINYQGRLTDGAGVPVTGDCSVRFSLYTTASGGTALWQETQTVPVDSGVFNAVLGTYSSIGADVFRSDRVYLGIKVASDAEMTPRQRITSVAYSYMAAGGDAPFEVLQNYTTGGAGRFNINNPENEYAALHVETDGIGPGIESYSTGTAAAGIFIVDNPDSTDAALSAYSSGNEYSTAVYGYHVGSGKAADFNIGTQTNPNDAMHVSTWGTGRVGHFELLNPNNGSPALEVTTTGSGPAIQGYSTGTASAGLFMVDNPASTDAALYAYTSGGSFSTAVYADSVGAGKAADFRIGIASNPSDAMHVSSWGTGKVGYLESYNTGGTSPVLHAKTLGRGSSGKFEIANAANVNPAVLATTSGTGPAVKAEGNVEISGAGKGVKFPDGSLQTTSASSSYKGRFYLLASQSVPVGYTVLPMTADYDPNYNWSSPYYTVPVTGYYMMNARVYMQNIPSGAQPSVSVATSTGYTYMYAYAAYVTALHSETVTLSDIVYLTAGTQICMKVYAPSTLTVTGSKSGTCMSIHLLSY